MPPFRQPASDEWEAPDYFKPETSEASSEWKAPDYFKPEKEEEKKPSEFKRRASKAAELFVRDVKSIPSAVSGFLDEHPKLKAAGRKLLHPVKEEDLISPEDKAKGFSLQGEEFQKIPGLEAAGNWIRNKGINTGNYYLGAGASLLGSLVGSAAVMGDPRAMALKEAKGELPIRQTERPSDFVSKSKEIPYKADKIPATRKLLGPAPDFISGERGIADTSKQYSRDTSDLYSIQQPHGGTLTSADIGERTQISPEIAAKYGLDALPVREPIRPSPEEAVKTLEGPKESPFNPFEKRTSEEELTKGFGGSGHPESADYTSKVLSDAGKGEAGLSIEDKEGFKHVVYRNKKGEPVAVAKIVSGPDGKNLIQDLAADKTKGLLTGRATKAIGDKLVELKATESSGTISSDAQNFLDKMKDRMAKAADIKPAEAAEAEIPKPDESLPSQRQPIAKFRYDWPEAGGKQYDIHDPDGLTGGFHRSTVSEPRLKSLGIEIPEESQSARDAAHVAETAAEGSTKYRKPIGEWKPPDYFKPEEGIGTKIGKFMRDEEGSAENPFDKSEEEDLSKRPMFTKGPKGEYARTMLRNTQGKILPNLKGSVPDSLDEFNAYKAKGEAQVKYLDIAMPNKIKETIEYLRDRAKWGIERFQAENVPGQVDELKKASKHLNTLADILEKDKTPETLYKIKSEIEADVDKAPTKPEDITEMHGGLGLTGGSPPDYFKPEEPTPPDMDRVRANLPPNPDIAELLEEEASGRRPNDMDLEIVKPNITIMHGGLGLTGGSIPKQPSTGPHAAALDKLFGSLEESKGLTDVQAQMYRKERAQRFSEYADPSIRGGGVEGAAKRLSKLKGQYEKVEPLYGKLQLDEKETGSLFDAVDKANIGIPEKARATVALGKLINGNAVPQRNELALLDEIFGNNFASRITEMHGGIGAIGIKVGKTANTMKSMLNSLNIAAPILHGLPMVNRPEFWAAGRDMIKFMGNKEAFNAAQEAIRTHPNYIFSRDSGLFTARPESLTAGEEDFANSYVGNIPGVKQTVAFSQRGYVGFLNELRFKSFNNLLKNAKDMGENIEHVLTDEKGVTTRVPTKLAKDLAKYINNSTDRGSLGKLEKMAPELNYVLWSPRRLAARAAMLNPMYYKGLEPFAKKQALKSLFAQAAAGTSMVTLGVLAGGKTSMDPSNPDFMKVRFKDHVLNPLGPSQSIVVAAAKTIGELHRMGTGQKAKFGEQNIAEIGGNLLRNRESPIVRLADEIATSKQIQGDKKEGDLSTLSPPEAGGFTNRFGQKKYITAEIRNSFTPIFVQDVEELLKFDSSFAESIGLAGASALGVSVQPTIKKKSKLSLGR